MSRLSCLDLIREERVREKWGKKGVEDTERKGKRDVRRSCIRIPSRLTRPDVSLPSDLSPLLAHSLISDAIKTRETIHFVSRFVCPFAGTDVVRSLSLVACLWTTRGYDDE